MDGNDQGNTVIRCNDTDILIIMMSNVHLFENSSVWLDVGLEYNNSRHYVDIKATVRNVGYVRALPGIYAFTGCDYTPAFLRKGKKQPIEIMIKNKVYADAFSKLGEEELDDETFATIEAFTCAMSGYTNLENIEVARHSYCQVKCKPETYSEPLEALKHVDPSMFPPCRSVLVQQIKRSWLVAKLYKGSFK